MKRERRQEIMRRTLLFIANAVHDLPDIDGGLYDGLAEYGTSAFDEETSLARTTCEVVCERLRRQADRIGHKEDDGASKA